MKTDTKNAPPLAFIILKHLVFRDGRQKWLAILERWKQSYAANLSIPAPKISDFNARVLYPIFTNEALPLNENGTAKGADELIATHLLASEIPDDVSGIEKFLKKMIDEYVLAQLGRTDEINLFVAKELSAKKAQQIQATPTTQAMAA